MDTRRILTLTAAAAMMFGATASGFAQTGSMRTQQDMGMGSQQDDSNTGAAPRGMGPDDFDASSRDLNTGQINNLPNARTHGGFDRNVNGSDASTPGRN